MCDARESVLSNITIVHNVTLSDALVTNVFPQS